MLFPLNGNQAGLYMRLSRDEDATRESNSIVNQRKILTDFASKNGFVVVDEYVDDGYSGSNFRRPAFEKMLEDARNRRIDVVIVKDLSRLGRDYIGTGEYMEKIFPRLGVRFIAIADGDDGRDNEDPSADMMPMINFFNEYHSKQTSKKTRASKKVMAQAGKFIGTKAPYGYILDPADKHHLLIDPEAARILDRRLDEVERAAERQATEEFVRAIAAYQTLSGLNRTILNELIERVDIRTVTEAKQGVPRLSVTYKQNIFIDDCLKQRQEVSGSIPLISTTKKTENLCFQSFFFCFRNFLQGYSLLGYMVEYEYLFSDRP